MVTIGPEASVKEAFRVMKSLGIRHLPVVQDGELKGMVTDKTGKLAGIITESDILRAYVAGKK